MSFHISIGFVFLFVLSAIRAVTSLYEVPDVTLDALRTGGFRAYIEDTPGISIFAFHANINEEIFPQENGSLNKVTSTPQNGNWIVEFPTQLKVGDVVNYWVFVTVNSLGFRKDRLRWNVEDLVDSYPPFRVDCVRGSTVINGGTPTCINQVVLNENFNAGSIHDNDWIVEQYIPTYAPGPRNEFNTYENRDETRFIKNGVLFLKPVIRDSEEEVRQEINLNDGCTSSKDNKCFYRYGSAFLVPPVKSARITTQTSFKYGKIDILAKLPTGDWVFPILQLEPKNDEEENSPAVWIAYSRGNDHLRGNNQDDLGSRLLFGGPVLHPKEPGRSTRLVSQTSEKPYNSQFHLYTLIWKPGEMTFLIDSRRYGTVDLTKSFADPDKRYGTDWSATEAPFDKEYVLSLGVGVAGIRDFPDGYASGNTVKPWINEERNQVKKFFDARRTWSKTWKGDDSALQIDSVKITAL